MRSAETVLAKPSLLGRDQGAREAVEVLGL